MKSLAWIVMALTSCVSIASSAASATPPAALPTDVYGRLPSIELMQLSPSGERIAYITVKGDRRTLVIKDIGGAQVFSGPAQDTKMRSLRWAGDDRLLLTASVTTKSLDVLGEFAEMLVVNLATSKSFIVFENNPSVFHAVFGYYGAVHEGTHWYGYFSTLTLQKTRGFDATFSGDGTVDLYKVDLDTGSSALASTRLMTPHEWAVDGAGKVVAHSEYAPATGIWTLRPGGAGDTILARITDPLAETEIEGLGRSSDTVIVRKAEPEEWSVSTGVHAPLKTDRLIDDYLFDPTDRQLVGVTLSGDRPEDQFFDQRLAARQTALRKALGATARIVSWSDNRKRLLLLTETDTDAGTYWVVDGASAKPYAYVYPDIPDANVAATSMITYSAGDHLELHGVVTLPPGRDPHGLPLVVIPHGGPQAHDNLGFDWLAQAFAGRGYAVFQPNFRGSDGYGLDFRDAGFGEWGRKMQTDISDGVATLIAIGTVDAKRVCIVGASYGGYAALAGVTVQQGLYRCAVSYAGISDLGYLLEHESPEAYDTRNPGNRYLRKYLGAKSNDDPVLRDLSPLHFAGRADAPILLIHGLDDTVVPILQSREMEQALKHAGKPVEFVTLKAEDHWLSRDATRKAMLAAAVAFVEAHNPAE